MSDVYKLEINVNGAASGSEELGQQQGQVIEGEQVQVARQQRQSVTSIIEQRIGAERFDTIKKTAGVATGIGYIALDLYQQEQSFRGDSNRNLRINEKKKWAGTIGATATLLLSGNYIGAAVFVGYTALGLAKENRELLNERKIDQYRSQYYQQRLVRDTTQRSR